MFLARGIGVQEAGEVFAEEPVDLGFAGWLEVRVELAEEVLDLVGLGVEAFD